MTSPDRNYDDVLRRAFHAMADPIEPAGDGLTRIRKQIDGPWLRRQSWLLLRDCVDLVVLLFVRLQSLPIRIHSTFAGMGALSAWLGTGLIKGVKGIPPGLHRGYWALRDRFASLSFRGAGWSFVPEAGRQAPQQRHAAPHRMAPSFRRRGSALAWMRPALAVAAVLAVVAVGAVGLSRFPEMISPSALRSGGSNGGSNPGQVGPGVPNGQGTPGGSGSASSKSPGSRIAGKDTREPKSSATPTPSCPPAAQPTPSPGASGNPTPTSSPTATPTVSSSPTPSDSSTPAAGSTPPTPAASTGAGASAQHYRTDASTPCTTPTPGAPQPTASPTTSSASLSSVTQAKTGQHLAARRHG